MDLVTAIMRQHRRIQSAAEAILRGSRPRSAAMTDLFDTLMLHATAVDAVLTQVGYRTVRRVLAAHRVHHVSIRRALFRITSCEQVRFDRDFEELRQLIGHHARHEAEVVTALRELTDGELLGLGEELSRFDWPAPTDVAS